MGQLPCYSHTTVKNDDQTRPTPTNTASPQFDKSLPLHRDDNTDWLTVGGRRVEVKSTIILGDSTIKYVDSRRMKCDGKNVFRKCFPCSSKPGRHEALYLWFQV